MNILIWLLAAYGMSNILVYGSIFQGMRNWFQNMGNSNYVPFNGLFKFVSELLSCMMCTSTWSGFFMSLVVYSPWHEIMGSNQFVSIFFDGMLASGFVWAINSIVEWFEENRLSKQKIETTYIVEEEDEAEILND
jgi:hypothetical protein